MAKLGEEDQGTAIFFDEHICNWLKSLVKYRNTSSRCLTAKSPLHKFSAGHALGFDLVIFNRVVSKIRYQKVHFTAFT